MSRLRVAPLLAVAPALGIAALLSSASPATGQVSGPPTLDNFNRPNEDPLSGGGNWAQADLGIWNPMRLVSNAARRSASGTSMSYWTQNSFAGGEGSVWARYGGLGDQAAVSIGLLKDVGGTNAVDGYELRREVAGIVENQYYILYRMTNGGRTNIGGVENPPEAGYPYFNLRRVGNTVEAWASPDGQTWTLFLSATDSTYTTGTFYPTIHANGTGPENMTLDDFGAAASGIPQTTSLTVTKMVVNDNGGSAIPANWTMNVAGPTPLSFPGSSAGTTNTVQPGAYTVTESGGPAGYLLSYSGDCAPAGQVTIATGETKTCTLTNNDQAAPPSGGPAGRSNGILGGRGSIGLSGTFTISDPVNTFTGFFVHQEQDLSTPGTGVPFEWTRSYTSGDATVGPLGPGWTHTYAASLTVQGNGDVLARGEEGQEVYFTRQANGSFVGAAGARATLTSVAGGYELRRTDQVVYAFNTAGKLLSIKDRNAQGVTLGYDGQGRLATITDATSRQTTVSYNASNLVSQVSTVGGRSVSYGYTSGRLTSFTDVRGKNWAYTYDAGGRLATIVDPLNHTQVTNVSDASGRVTSQTDAVNKTTTFAWDAGTEVATVTDANNKVWKHDYTQGVLAKEIDPLTNETVLGHDGDLNETAVTSPTSQQTTMTYDAAGNLLRATAPPSLGSAQKTFVYNARNDVELVTDARGKVTDYAYNPTTGNLTSVVQDGIQVGSYTYDTAGRVLTFTDGNEKTTTYTYFPATGDLESVTDHAGNKTTYTYDPAGRVATRVDPKGNVAGCGCAAQFTWTYTYNAAGQQLTETNPLGHTTTNVYDDAARLTSETDANGHTTSYTYDNANRVLTETAPDPDGAEPQQAPVTTYTYDNVGNKLTETDPRGNTTTFAYDSANRLISETGPDPDGGGPLAAPVTTHTYDPNSNLASTVEPRGNATGATPADFRTTYTYDAAGRLLTETQPDPDGAGPGIAPKTTNTYDQVGNLATVKDGNDHVTSYTYDAAGRILTVTAPDLGVTTYTYDDIGNVLTRRDDNQHTTTYAYDNASRLASETSPDPDGPGPDGPAVTTYTYDPNGNRLTMTDPNGNATGQAGDGVTTYGYDRANRLTSIDYSDTTPDVTFTYDNVGNRLTMVDGQGTETRSYDDLDRLLSVTRGSDSLSYQYDPASNLTRRTYPGPAVTDYTYDPLNRMSSVVASGQTTTYAYDIASNLTQTTLPSANGYSEARVYDRAGRLTEVATTRASAVTGSEAKIPQSSLQQTQFSGGVTDIDEDPDAPDGLWMVASGAAPSVRLSFATPSYSPVGQLTFKARVRRQSGGSGTRTARIDLYENGGLRSTGTSQTITSTSGQTITQTFDASVVTDKTGAAVEARLVGATTQGTKSIDLGALRWTQAAFVVSPQTLARFQYTLDPVGNPTQVVRSGAIAETQSYLYDASDRLTRVCYYAAPCLGGGGSTTSWAYDRVGNRLDESGTTFTYDARDRLLEADPAGIATPISYSYDQNGNLLQATAEDTVVDYGYDLANRLTSVLSGPPCPACLGPQLPSTDAGYAYDGDGKRVEASDAGVVTRYLWDVNHPLPQLGLERTGQGALVRRYQYGHGRVSQTTPTGTFYFHRDNLGSVAGLTSQSGPHETSFAYEPFGSVRSEQRNAAAPPASVMRFTGEQLDPTGLYHLLARQYDPSVGRFLSRDPAEQTPSGIVVTSYGYAASRPTVMVDPSGTVFLSPNWFTSWTRRASSPEAVEPATSSRALAPNAIIRRLRHVSSQTTRVTAWHSTANMGLPTVSAFKLTQEIDWGPVTQRSAVVKQVTFRYRLLTIGIVQGGRWDVYGGGDPYHYRSGFDDFDKAYSRSSNGKESGELTIRLNEVFTDDESFYVTVDKRSQFGSIYLGDDFARKMRVAYGP